MFIRWCQSRTHQPGYLFAAAYMSAAMPRSCCTINGKDVRPLCSSVHGLQHLLRSCAEVIGTNLNGAAFIPTVTTRMQLVESAVKFGSSRPEGAAGSSVLASSARAPLRYAPERRAGRQL